MQIYTSWLQMSCAPQTMGRTQGDISDCCLRICPQQGTVYLLYCTSYMVKVGDKTTSRHFLSDTTRLIWRRGVDG